MAHAQKCLCQDRAAQGVTYPIFSPATMRSVLISPERSTLLSIATAHLACTIQMEQSKNLTFLYDMAGEGGRGRHHLFIRLSKVTQIYTFSNGIQSTKLKTNLGRRVHMLFLLLKLPQCEGSQAGRKEWTYTGIWFARPETMAHSQEVGILDCCCWFLPQKYSVLYSV